MRAGSYPQLKGCIGCTFSLSITAATNIRVPAGFYSHSSKLLMVSVVNYSNVKFTFGFLHIVIASLAFLAIFSATVLKFSSGCSQSQMSLRMTATLVVSLCRFIVTSLSGNFQFCLDFVLYTFEIWQSCSHLLISCCSFNYTLKFHLMSQNRQGGIRFVHLLSL